MLITTEQKEQLEQFVEDVAKRALAEVPLDEDVIQRLIKNGDELQSRIVAVVQELSVNNQYINEEVRSSYGYFSGYQPKPIAEQVKILRELFPELGSVGESLAEADLPSNAEGWFAIPKWSKIAPTYNEALKRVLRLISKASNGKLYTYCGGKELDFQYLRQHKRTVAMLKRIGDAQSEHDILVVPAQFGLRHRGRSVRRAREMFNAFEFGLGAFQVAVMILTHPERLSHGDDLLPDCAGDEYVPPGLSFLRDVFFIFGGDGDVKFFARWDDSADASCGSVSAFLPQ